MTKEEWIQRYEGRAEEYELQPDGQEHFDPERGLLSFCVRGDALVIDHCCTRDMAWGYAWFLARAKELGCQRLMTQTFRDPAAYLRKSRLIGAHPHLVPALCGLRPNGHYYFVFEQIIGEKG